MKNNTSVIVAALVGLVIIAFVVTVRSNRQSYWVAHKAADQTVIIAQIPDEQVLEWRIHHWFER